MRIEFYPIEGPWPGRLAILLRPRGGDWLADEVRAWGQAGLDVVVSALVPDEIADFELAQEAERCRAAGIHFLSFPIPDRSVPSSNSAVLQLAKELEQGLADGKHVGIHCRQGIGRSGVIAACLMILAGFDPATALARVSAARGRPVPETDEQRRWVTEFARHLATTSR